MTYIVAEPCVECKYTDCAAVCPVEAFHELPDKLLINPDTCIDCDACLPECPVEAIFEDVALPAEWKHFEQINAGPTAWRNWQGHEHGPGMGHRFESALYCSSAFTNVDITKLWPTTVECAWFLGQEGRLGSLEVGRHADLIVLSDDYFSVRDAEIRKVRAVTTIVDGRIVT